MTEQKPEKPEKPGKPGQEVAQAQDAPATASEVVRAMSPTRRAQMEAGLVAYHETAEQIDRLKDELDNVRQDLRARDMEVSSLREQMDAMKENHATVLNASESRATAAMAERDRAVSETTALKTIIASMKRIFEMAPP
jgi:chromosome segregation ATPase